MTDTAETGVVDYKDSRNNGANTAVAIKNVSCRYGANTALRGLNLDIPKNSIYAFIGPSGGQQQRLCIARALMLEPQLLLFDEPCSALDPISTFKIEELLINLKEERTIIIVTHNIEQASRIADYTAFFYLGELIEAGESLQIFQNPRTELLKRYITGKF